MYFGNVEIPDSASVGSNSDSDDEDVTVNDIQIVSGVLTGNVVEQNENDSEEFKYLHDFKVNGCGCVRLYGKSCSSVVDWDKLVNYRQQCQEMSKSELDMLIKVQLFHHRNDAESTSGKKHKQKVRERVRQEYIFNGKPVCRITFAFAHDVYRKTIDSIARSLDIDGLIPRTHGNTGKQPSHALTLQDVQNLKQFLTHYSTVHGVPLPGRMPNCRQEKVVLLPSDKTKSDIYSEYLVACENMNYRTISLSEFKRVWLEQCPYILRLKPATDLCHKCQSYVNKMCKGGNLTEEEKCELLGHYNDHIVRVKQCRDYYRQQCEDAKLAFSTLQDENTKRGQEECSLDTTFHYSFDYAQQVHYPHYAQQVGPLFFKTPRKCQCFGVCSEASGSQIFYLLDESVTVGKGANSVVSMLHHHCTYQGYGEKHVQFHMDNCTGQNKNNTVIGYGLWRVLTKRHISVEFSLMEAGHTKFHPDWHFGIWKVRWRHATAESMAEVAKTVSDSSRSGHNIPCIVDDPQHPVLFSDWASFLKKFFLPVPSLKKYHHFRMEQSSPGTVFVKEYPEDEEKPIHVLKKGITAQSLAEVYPAPLVINGLCPERQWYLYEEVAPYCNKTSACPLPKVPKPSGKCHKDVCPLKKFRSDKC